MLASGLQGIITLTTPTTHQYKARTSKKWVGDAPICTVRQKNPNKLAIKTTKPRAGIISSEACEAALEFIAIVGAQNSDGI